MGISVRTGYKPVVSSSKAASSSKSTSSSKATSSNKATSSSKVASSSKAISSSKSAGSSKPTTSYTSATSSYKPANASKAKSTYKPPASYYNYKTTSVVQKSKSSSTIYGMDRAEVSTKKPLSNTSGSAIHTIQASIKSKLKTGTEICSAAIESVKKKVEKSLSDTAMDLRKAKDYINRLNKVYKAGLDSAGKQICNEVSETIDLSKKAVKKKGGLGADAINLILTGCEKLTNTVIKGSMKLGESTLSAVLNVSQKTIGAVEEVIDFINPSKKQLSVKQIIKGVEDGKIKLTNAIQKGNYGEMKMDQYYAGQGYVRLSKDRVMSLDEPVHQGIDGIYYNVDKQKGEPAYIIAEAKYNQSKLGYTKYDGRQMSDKWILRGDRIEKAVGDVFEKEVRNALYTGNCEKQVVHIFPDGICKIQTIK